MGGGYSLDYDTLLKSTSGGAFMELCKAFYKRFPHGIVYGVAMDADLQVVHDFATDLEGCRKFRSSKYVQSEVRDVYTEVRKMLKKGNAVYFSGTPCQVSALKASNMIIYIHKQLFVMVYLVVSYGAITALI